MTSYSNATLKTSQFMIFHFHHFILFSPYPTTRCHFYHPFFFLFPFSSSSSSLKLKLAFLLFISSCYLSPSSSPVLARLGHPRWQSSLSHIHNLSATIFHVNHRHLSLPISIHRCSHHTSPPSSIIAIAISTQIQLLPLIRDHKPSPSHRQAPRQQP